MTAQPDKRREHPGEIRSPDGEIALSPDRPRQRVRVTSRSARPVRVSSHYPFWRVNPRLEFDRAATVGYRLDVPAGTSVRWAPGAVEDVDLVAYRADARPPAD
ncbi:MAG TPA: urease subunit beta [Streptosporangiaceae bacterium]